MPAEVTHKSPFRLRVLVIAFFLTLGTGYVLGMAHAQSLAPTMPGTTPTVHVTPTPPTR